MAISGRCQGWSGSGSGAPRNALDLALLGYAVAFLAIPCDLFLMPKLQTAGVRVLQWADGAVEQRFSQDLPWSVRNCLILPANCTVKVFFLRLLQGLS